MPSIHNEVRKPVKVAISIHNATNESIKAAEQQTYRNIDIVTNTEGEGASEFYNKTIKNSICDVHAFIDGNCILDKNCIATVLQQFEWSHHQFVGAIYSDCYMLNPKTNIKYEGYYYPYSKKQLRTTIINPYLFVNGGIVTEIFDPRLKALYFYDALIKISSNTIIYHIPKPLYTAKIDNKEISNDLQILKINVKR